MYDVHASLIYLDSDIRRYWFKQPNAATSNGLAVSYNYVNRNRCKSYTHHGKFILAA